MTKISLIISLLLPGFVISTHRLKSQDSDSILCLKTRHIDFLILEKVSADFLRKDTALKGGNIRALNKVVSKQADIISNTESIVLNKDKIIEGWRKSYDELNVINAKTNRKLFWYKGGTMVFGGIVLVLSGLFLVLVN